MVVNISCKYCGHRWSANIYNKVGVKCPKCGDTDLKVSNPEDNKIDYYAGSPAFKDDTKSDISDNLFEHPDYSFF